MPELPEVETTRRGIEPWLVGRRIDALKVREWRLRWRVPRGAAGEARGRAHPRRRPAREVPAGRNRRRHADPASRHVGKPSHPRRGGSRRSCTTTSISCSTRGAACGSTTRAGSAASCSRPASPRGTSCSRGLAVEPLSDEFTGEALWRRARGRRAAIKTFIMDSRVVAGVGNIYASEALFRAGIRPVARRRAA